MVNGTTVRTRSSVPRRAAEPADYRLDEQVGFILRQVAQRHAVIFAAGIDGDVTPTQWAALSKLAEVGPVSQNKLGRLTVMDAATIKGVIDRLSVRALAITEADPTDGRRRMVSLTDAGRAMVDRLLPAAARITEDTLAPLDARERTMLRTLLLKLR